ncbi:DUF819 family protein [Marinicauda algicola]|uniref:DUF819 family protein n=1 Tax=Marinicauda algicola TaxID=2029849 RepID=A0A4S2H318_9PROT|nr:DUF819 family protein [Marinicauda algicola]TGY89946.1 DUF819 family protein [Marinicauda algicola]
MDSLIPAEAHLAVMAALFAIAGAGFLLERTRIGALLTGTVWTILLAILASNFRIIPFDAPAYDFVFAYFVPVLIPLFLMKADLRRIFFETTRIAIAFLICTAATVAGALLAALLLDLGALEAAITGSLTASYIGGSVNFAPLTEQTGLAANEPALVSAIVAADHLASAAWLGILALLPGFAWLARRFVARDHTGGTIAETGEASEGRASALSLGLTLTFALVVVAVSDWITAMIGMPGLRYVIITVLAVIPATLFPNQMAKLHGGFELGVVLAFVFFGAIAAGANVPDMISQAPMIMAFIALLIAIHGAVMLVVGSIARLSLPEMIIASNAAILGATTAPALAAAKGWKDLVTPGVLAGVLGYVIGTGIALGVYALLS